MTLTENVRAGVCTGDGPCDVVPIGQGKNWLLKVDGLPVYIRAIAHALLRGGMEESHAVSTAVATVKRWAAGEGKVTAQTRARAGKAVAEWEAKKSAAHASDHDYGDRAFVTIDEARQAARAASDDALADVPHAFRGSDLHHCKVCGMSIMAKLHVYGPKSNKAAEEALAPAREAAGLGKRALESVGLRWTFDPDQPRERGEWSKAADIKGGEKAAAEVKAAGRADRIKSFGTGWHVADPPRYSHMKEWDCQVCGVETLKKPVFLEKDGQRVCAGTGCATSLVGMGDRPGAKAGIERQRDAKLSDAKRQAAVDQERAQRYQTALGQFEDWRRELGAARAADEDVAPVQQKMWASDFGKLTKEYQGHGTVEDPAGMADYLRKWLGDHVDDVEAAGVRAIGGFVAESTSSAADLLPNGIPPAQAQKVEATMGGKDSYHVFIGKDLLHCSTCGRPIGDKVHWPEQNTAQAIMVPPRQANLVLAGRRALEAVGLRWDYNAEQPREAGKFASTGNNKGYVPRHAARPAASEAEDPGASSDADDQDDANAKGWTHAEGVKGGAVEKAHAEATDAKQEAKDKAFERERQEAFAGRKEHIKTTAKMVAASQRHSEKYTDFQMERAMGEIDSLRAQLSEMQGNEKTVGWKTVAKHAAFAAGAALGPALAVGSVISPTWAAAGGALAGMPMVGKSLAKVAGTLHDLKYISRGHRSDIPAGDITPESRQHVIDMAVKGLMEGGLDKDRSTRFATGLVDAHISEAPRQGVALGMAKLPNEAHEGVLDDVFPGWRDLPDGDNEISGSTIPSAGRRALEAAGLRWTFNPSQPRSGGRWVARGGSYVAGTKDDEEDDEPTPPTPFKDPHHFYGAWTHKAGVKGGEVEKEHAEERERARQGAEMAEHEHDMFSGVPHEGDQVKHPVTKGIGTVTRVRDLGNGHHAVTVHWDTATANARGSAFSTHDAYERGAKPGEKAEPPGGEDEHPLPTESGWPISQSQLKELEDRTYNKGVKGHLSSLGLQGRAAQARQDASAATTPGDRARYEAIARGYERAAAEVPLETAPGPERPHLGPVPAPASGWKALSPDETRSWMEDEASKSGFLGSYGRRLLEQNVAKSHVHLYQDGSYVNFKSAASKARRQELLDEVERARQTYPEHEPLQVTVGSPPRGKHFGAGVMGSTRTGTGQMWIAPATMSAEGDRLTKQQTGTGAWMSGGATDASAVRSVFSHELGHTMDVGERKPESRAALNGGRVSWTHNPDLSMYGRTVGRFANPDAEAFAEAFAEWHLSHGDTKNPTVLELAKQEGWRK